MKGRLSRITILALIFISIAFSLTGCASQFLEVKVGYDLQNEIKNPVLDTGKISLYVEKFSDVRGNIGKNVIGSANTGFFDKITPVLIKDSDIEELSTKGVMEAFRKIGFNITSNEKDADLVFKGRINTFWVQEFPFVDYLTGYCKADVEFDIVLIDKNSKKTLWFDVKKNHIKSEKSSDPTEFIESIINDAFNKTILSMLNDKELASAMNDFIRTRK